MCFQGVLECSDRRILPWCHLLSAHWPSARMAVLAARGGEVTVMVPAEVADRFNKALVREGRREQPRRTLGCSCPN